MLELKCFLFVCFLCFASLFSPSEKYTLPIEERQDDKGILLTYYCSISKAILSILLYRLSS